MPAWSWRRRDPFACLPSVIDTEVGMAFPWGAGWAPIEGLSVQYLPSTYIRSVRYSRKYFRSTEVQSGVEIMEGDRSVNI